MLAAAGIAPPYSLVPVPSSGLAVGLDVVSRTVALAEAIRVTVDSPDVTVLDAIRWDVPLAPAHEGGPRFADEVYPHVRVVAALAELTRIVLVDDVKTSGGHFQAVAAGLREERGDIVYAVGGGRTVYEPPADSWAVITEVLPDYDPDEF
jgi:hypothetical protein